MKYHDYFSYSYSTFPILYLDPPPSDIYGAWMQSWHWCSYSKCTNVQRLHAPLICRELSDINISSVRHSNEFGTWQNIFLCQETQNLFETSGQTSTTGYIFMYMQTFLLLFLFLNNEAYLKEPSLSWTSPARPTSQQRRGGRAQPGQRELHTT